MDKLKTYWTLIEVHFWNFWYICISFFSSLSLLTSSYSNSCSSTLRWLLFNGCDQNWMNHILANFTIGSRPSIAISICLVIVFESSMLFQTICSFDAIIGIYTLIDLNKFKTYKLNYITLSFYSHSFISDTNYYRNVDNYLPQNTGI